MEQYVIGVDYGTDSVRALVVDARDGREVSSAVCHYPRWKAGLYCDPAEGRYRQHPLDYIESLESVVGECLGSLTRAARENIRGISFDTTGSTPAMTDGRGVPLALTEGFEQNPNAMFILWKDHTAIREAEHINECARRGETDCTLFSGGTYSPEWAWSKALHVLRTDSGVRIAARSWVEHCDWIGALLTGDARPEHIRRSRCAAGHKAMWNAAWGGYPPEEFLARVDPVFEGWRERLGTETFTNGVAAGTITAEWAARLGVPEGITVGVGALDAHIGAIGAGISPNVLTRIMGTSTCDILACEPAGLPPSPIRGICGQVDGSVLEGMTGLEAGQSAFGDVYAWFAGVLAWGLTEFAPEGAAAADRIIPRLSAQAERIAPGESSVLALDWLNGRRTPDANLALRGAVSGLTLGTTPAMIFRALVEATAYGSRAIVERFISEGVRIDSIIAIGGIARKSPLVMQILSEVLDMPVRVVDTDQACALGAAMCAAAACGIYPSVRHAQKAMAAPLGREYLPDERNARVYGELYDKYLRMGDALGGL